MAALKELRSNHKILLAYAHPLREQIFTLLTEHPATPAEMTRKLGLPRKELPNVVHHVKYLVKLDCAEEVGEREDSGATIYTATALAQIDLGEWDALRNENPAFADYIVCRAMQLQIDDFVAGVRAGLIGEEDEHFYVSRKRRVLDLPGLLESLELKVRAQKELDEIERRSAERRSESGADAIHVSDGLSLFRVPPPAA